MRLLTLRLFSGLRFLCGWSYGLLLPGLMVLGHGVAVAQPTSAIGRVSEPLGSVFVAQPAPVGQLTRITFYRPPASAAGVAHLEVGEHYHTSLQTGAFSELCLVPGAVEVFARMVQMSQSLRGFREASVRLNLAAQEDRFVRVAQGADGRAVLALVEPNQARSELLGLRRQIHTVSRVTAAQDCAKPGSPLVAPASTHPAAPVVMGAQGLFAFNQSGLSHMQAPGRQALDDLLTHLQQTHGGRAGVRWHVQGHADPIGEFQRNQELSEARAGAVRDYLQARGVAAQAIRTEALGARQPLVTHCRPWPTQQSIRCNAPNRRVEVGVEVLAR